MLEKYLLGDEFSEKRGRFLQNILQSAKEGHLCLQADELSPLPPLDFIVQDQNRYYLQKNFVYETKLLEAVQKFQTRTIAPSAVFTEKVLGASDLSDEQKGILLHLFTHPFAIVCGGPGTGKTYTAGKFLESLASVKPSLRVAVTAPTGKAALHLQSVFKGEAEAATLHRLLKLRPDQTNLSAMELLDFDVVIVDEASMIDVALLAHLVSAIGDTTRLILMGDPNQLPPIEGGGIFGAWASLFGVQLTKCMRTQEPQLLLGASAIVKGDAPQFFEKVPWQEEISSDALYDWICPLIAQEKIDPKMALGALQKRRALNALRQGPSGTEALNRELLKRMDEKCPPGWWWAVPILSTTNLPHLQLSNGSFGVVIGKKGRSLELSQGTVYFEEHLEGLPVLPPHELSFLLSVHKAQGSEFPEVLALFPEASEAFGREVLYTAATRAKKSLRVVGKKEVLKKLLEARVERKTGFLERWIKSC